MAGKCGKRPCAVCRKWFAPKPRAGSRQTVCDGDDCQRERHRRACAKWRAKNPDHDAAQRLRKRLEQARRSPPAPPPSMALPEHWWGIARDAVGAKMSVVVQECAKVLDRRARDAVGAKMLELPGSSAKVLPREARDAFAADRGPP